MSVKILSITLLLLSMCVCFSYSAGPPGPGSKRPCCVNVTDIDMSPEVVGETYREQAAKPPCVKAIIFNTEYGQLCADPKAQWVKDLTAKMRKE
ncbi:C-C motif chemokine 2 [Maylandia zebra]|uniref:C-C motif chemokine 2 n=2 Tax=Haplochromini TaxID=319058 RepID=A0A3P9CU62_9CICH|nr:C-C motif chemokine 2 [Maylandia zebra]XP_026036072.1 C-C motif chemokine 2-like [Astatotilapia calliptera]